ncbi:MAG: hypothetical protein AABY53_00320 [Bdellovibrionota bacterium]
MKTTLILLTTLISSLTYAGRTEVCPVITPVMISPQFEVKVDFDKKNQNYTYKYKITNLASAKAPIWRFIVETKAAPIAIKSGKNWDSDPGYDSEGNRIQWSSDIDYKLKPGQSLDGFEIVSKSPPGLIKVYSEGWRSELPTIKFDTDEEAEQGDHESIACTGFYDGAMETVMVSSIITGPSVPNRVEAKIRLKRVKEKKWKGQHHEDPDMEISPLEPGKIQLMLLGDKIIDVAKINLSTLEFGRGKAKPTKTQIIGEAKFKDDDSDDEFKEHLKKNKNAHLLMEFNLQDVDVKCDIDRALFLTGKIGTKDLFGAAKIKHVGCDKKTFSKEAKKIREHSGGH